MSTASAAAPAPAPVVRTAAREPFVPQPDDDMIVCRCEEITKGDLRRAVHAGLRTFPEIRRFTRCAMGLCQGRTCTRLAQGIVARELGVSRGDLLHPAARSPQRPLTMRELGNERF